MRRRRRALSCFFFNFIFGEGFFVSNNHLREEAGGKRSVSS
jgi:hypothetical protein